MDDKKTIEILLKLNDQMGAQLSAQTKNMNEAAAAAEALTKSVNESAEANKKAAASEKEITKKIKEHNSAIKKNVEEEAAKNSAIDGTINKLLGMASAYIAVSSAIGYAKAALESVVATGSEFEKTMSGTRAILQPTKAEFDALRVSARELGASTAFSASQVGEAQTELGKMGFDVGQVIASEAAVLELAAAANMTMADAATAASTVVKQFGLEASQTQEVVDIMAKSFSISALDASNFTEAMQYVGPVARAAGISVSEASAALGVLADEGIRGSMAGTSLRRIISVLSDSSSEAAKQLAKTHPEAKTLTEKLAALKSMGMDSTSAMKLFRIEAATGAIVLANSSAKVAEYGEKLQYAEGAAKGFASEVAKTQMDNFLGDLEQAKGQLEDVQIALFEAFGDAPREIINSLTSELEDLGDWINENPETIRNWAKAFETAINGAIVLVETLASVSESVANVMAGILPTDIALSGDEQFTEYADSVAEHLADMKRLQEKAKNTASPDMAAAYGRDAKREQEAAVIAAKNRDEAIKDLYSTITLLEAQVNIGETLSKEDQKTLTRSKELAKIAKTVAINNISVAEAQRRIANETKRRLELEAKGRAAVGKGSSTGAAADVVGGIDVQGAKDAQKEAAKNQQEADRQYRDLLRARELDELSDWQRQIQERKNYWDDKIETDKKGGSRHLAELEAWRDKEISAMFEPINPNWTFGGAIEGRVTPGAGAGANAGANGEAAAMAGAEALAQAQSKAYAEANAERMAQAEAIYIELENNQKSEIELEQEKYDEKLRLLQEFGNETEALTNAHEARMADIQARIWTDRLSAAEGFFGGFAKLADVAAKTNKDWANTAKALAIAEATMNTAVGITKAYAQGGVLGFITGAGVAAAGAAQIATITQQKYAQGDHSTSASFGLVPGTSYSGDKVLARVNSGERILSAQQNKEYENSRSSVFSSITYAPVYNAPISPVERRRDVRNFQKQMKAANSDRSFSRTQAAYV